MGGGGWGKVTSLWFISTQAGELNVVPFRWASEDCLETTTELFSQFTEIFADYKTWYSNLTFRVKYN